MNTRFFAMAAIGLALLLGACVSQGTGGNDTLVVTETHNEPTKVRPDNGEDCATAGGVWHRAGMLGTYRCTFEFDDAGKICRDSSECGGRCMNADGVTDYDAPRGKQVGVCAANDSPFGCYGTLENGTMSPMLCVD